MHLYALLNIQSLLPLFSNYIALGLLLQLTCLHFLGEWGVEYRLFEKFCLIVTFFNIQSTPS